jgi:hypothetical protein
VYEFSGRTTVGKSSVIRPRRDDRTSKDEAPYAKIMSLAKDIQRSIDGSLKGKTFSLEKLASRVTYV